MLVVTCDVNITQYRSLQAKLCKIMDKEKDSLCFYYLGNKCDTKIEHFGIKDTCEPEGILMV